MDIYFKNQNPNINQKLIKIFCCSLHINFAYIFLSSWKAFSSSTFISEFLRTLISPALFNKQYQATKSLPNASLRTSLASRAFRASSSVLLNRKMSPVVQFSIYCFIHTCLVRTTCGAKFSKGVV